MAESSVYEAACEIREPLQQVYHELAELTEAVRSGPDGATTRRDRFAAAAMAALLTRGGPWTADALDGPGIASLCIMTWRIADALDDADPRRAAKGPAAADEDDVLADDED